MRPFFDSFKKSKRDNLASIEDILINHSNKDKVLVQKIARYYGNRSWYLLFALKFNEAEQSAKKGLAIDTSSTLIKKNLAHSLLFEGKYEDALKIYKDLKRLKNEEGKSYTTNCLEDLDILEKNGVTNKDISKIREFLKE